MRRWTEEARQQQAERIRALCPWNKSTGPKTEEGKAKSCHNAWKGGVRADAAAYAKILRGIAGTTRRLFSSFRQKHAFSPSTISQPPSTRPFSSFGRKRGGNVQQRTLNAQHRTDEGGEFLFASIGDSLAVPSSGLSSDSLTANGTKMNANGNSEGQSAPAAGSTPLLGPSLPAEPGLFSSFGQNSCHQTPCSLRPEPSPPLAVPLPTDADLENLSNEEFLAMAAGMLGGGLFSSF